MKYLIVLCILIVGCSLPSDYYFEYEESFESPQEAYKWVKYHVPWTEDIVDYAQFPHETYELKTGDCEDRAGLLMYFLNDMGYEPLFVMYKGHRAVMCDDVLYFGIDRKINYTVTYTQYINNVAGR